MSKRIGLHMLRAGFVVAVSLLLAIPFLMTFVPDHIGSSVAIAAICSSFALMTVGGALMLGLFSPSR